MHTAGLLFVLHVSKMLALNPVEVKEGTCCMV